MEQVRTEAIVFQIHAHTYSKMLRTGMHGSQGTLRNLLEKLSKVVRSLYESSASTPFLQSACAASVITDISKHVVTEINTENSPTSLK